MREPHGTPPAFDLTSGPFSLAASAAGRLLAEGPLTFVSARSARGLGLDAIERAAGQGGLVIDCQGVTASDSAGLAVLLDWLAAARAQGCALRFAHLPQGLAALGRISEVSELLERGV
ncbi:MAG TPA: STAS domain-containing protein [Steroidobacteraceae bacterium]|nr:STAS domain-containing protein [Steroidobacteraceae bacterium]